MFTYNQTGAGADPRQEFAAFLQYQVRQSGLTVREIAERFKQAAAAEQASGTRLEHPVSSMKFSKSHIDRLLKAQALPSPPRPFTLQFLRITSHAAGLTAEEHKERCAVARALLDAISNAPAALLPCDPAPGPGSPAPYLRQATIATLRVEVELERARHRETRLRYALRDAQFLVTTMWDIIGALRDIISGHDVLLARGHHGHVSPDELGRLQNEAHQALVHKRTAQEIADWASARIRTLEELWEKARTDLRRLMLAPDASDLDLHASDPVVTPQPLLPRDLLAQPALDVLPPRSKRHRY